jgi:hypothetical protein
MDEHLALLLDLARQDDERRLRDDDLYVWWGKVRSPNRQQPLAHGAEVRAVAAAGEVEQSDETQLYLTDYRSLYVADVIGVYDGELPATEQTHVPAYYRQAKLSCDFWFRLGDIRRLVADDTLAVIEELKLLRNVHYNDRPVSIYGGMVDLPLVVTRPDGRRYFDERERDEVAAGRLWAEWDAEQGSGLGGIERELRENLLGDAVWRGACGPDVSSGCGTRLQSPPVGRGLRFFTGRNASGESARSAVQRNLASRAHAGAHQVAYGEGPGQDRGPDRARVAHAPAVSPCAGHRAGRRVGARCGTE